MNKEKKVSKDKNVIRINTLVYYSCVFTFIALLVLIGIYFIEKFLTGSHYLFNNIIYILTIPIIILLPPLVLLNELGHSELGNFWIKMLRALTSIFLINYSLTIIAHKRKKLFQPFNNLKQFIKKSIFWGFKIFFLNFILGIMLFAITPKGEMSGILFLSVLLPIQWIYSYFGLNTYIPFIINSHWIMVLVSLIFYYILGVIVAYLTLLKTDSKKSKNKLKSLLEDRFFS